MPRACPVCVAPRADLLAEGEDFEYGSLPGPFRMWRCRACGHGYLDPLPRPDQLETIYPPTYYTANPRSPIHFTGPVQQLKARREVERIVRLAGSPPPRRVVDVGCGDAERLVRLRQKLGSGTALLGVDLRVDPDRREVLARAGVEMAQGNVETDLGMLGEEDFDLVVLCQMIEHLRDPATLLQNVAKRLAPGGRVLIETPNLGGLDFRLFRRRYWGGYHFPRHFHVFGTQSLARVVEDAGLRTAKRGFLPSGFGIVSLRNRLGLTSIERGPRRAEVLHMRNPLVVGAEVGIETLWMALGGATSNQYLVAVKP